MKWHRDLIRPSVCTSLIPREVFILVEEDVDGTVGVKITVRVCIDNFRTGQRAKY